MGNKQSGSGKVFIAPSGGEIILAKSLKSAKKYSGIFVGCQVLCRDEFKSKYTGDFKYKWRSAEVIEVDKARVLIHFCGWSEKHDKWYDLESDMSKLAPLRLLSAEQRELGSALTEDQLNASYEYFMTGKLPAGYLLPSAGEAEEVASIPLVDSSRQRSSSASMSSARTLSITNNFAVGQKVEVQDIYKTKANEIISMWREAEVVEISGPYVKIHFFGWEEKWDVIIDVAKQRDRIRMPSGVLVAAGGADDPQDQWERMSSSGSSKQRGLQMREHQNMMRIAQQNGGGTNLLSLNSKNSEESKESSSRFSTKSMNSAEGSARSLVGLIIPAPEKSEGGNLSARSTGGNLSARSTGGNLSARSTGGTGNLSARSTGGNLSARSTGNLSARSTVSVSNSVSSSTVGNNSARQRAASFATPGELQRRLSIVLEEDHDHKDEHHNDSKDKGAGDVGDLKDKRKASGVGVGDKPRTAPSEMQTTSAPLPSMLPVSIPIPDGDGDGGDDLARIKEAVAAVKKRMTVEESIAVAAEAIKSGAATPLSSRRRREERRQRSSVSMSMSMPAMSAAEPLYSSRRTELAEEAFFERMEKAGLHIVEMQYDGNCLFRAVSYLLYGTEKEHLKLRHRCIDHIEKYRARFELFCTTDMNEHLSRMKKVGIYAEELEIRALEEVVDRVFDIYSIESLSSTIVPIHVNIDECNLLRGVAPVKLSFHGKNRYNAVMDEKQNYPLEERESTMLMYERVKTFEAMFSPHEHN